MKTNKALLHLLGEDRLEEVFQAFDEPNSGQNEFQNQVLLLKARWFSLKNQEVAGTASREDLDVGYAQVRKSLHHLLTNDAPHTQVPASAQGKNSWFWPAALVGALLIGLASAWFAFSEDNTQRKQAQNEQKRLEELVAPVKPEEKPAEASTSATAPPVPLQLPANSMALFQTSTRNVRYTLTSADIAPANSTEELVSIQLKCSNLGKYPLNFWNSSFRLDCDGSRIAPSGDLNKVVPERSDASGTLQFMVPIATQSFELIFEDFDQEKKLVLRR
jgi:hypothetical protein